MNVRTEFLKSLGKGTAIIVGLATTKTGCMRQKKKKDEKSDRQVNCRGVDMVGELH